MSSPLASAALSSSLNPEASNFVPNEGSNRQPQPGIEAGFNRAHQNHHWRRTIHWKKAKRQRGSGGGRGGRHKYRSMTVVPGGPKDDAGGRNEYMSQDASIRLPCLAQEGSSPAIASSPNPQETGRCTQDPESNQQQRNRASSETMSGNTSSSYGNNLPVYGQAITWKSDYTKSQEEFNRTRQRVRAVAPEIFKDKARPSGGPANIFPQTTAEWINFKSEVVKQRLNEVNKSVVLMKDRVKAAENMEKNSIARPALLPAFGDEPGQKVLPDVFSTVLSQPTIWSPSYLKVDGPTANWPTRAELLCHGDNRENDHAGKRVDRSLPPPRFPAQHAGMSFREQPPIKPYPMDQTAQDSDIKSIVIRAGEVETANKKMNEDTKFEAAAMQFLGADLLKEIGCWQKVERYKKADNRENKEKPPVHQPNGRREVRLRESEQENAVRGYAAANGTHIPVGLHYRGPDRFNPADAIFVDSHNKVRSFQYGVGWVGESRDKPGVPVGVEQDYQKGMFGGETLEVRFQVQHGVQYKDGRVAMNEAGARSAGLE